MDDPSESKGEMIAMITLIIIDLSIEENLWESNEDNIEQIVINLMNDELATLEVDKDKMKPVVIQLLPHDEEEIVLYASLNFNTKAVLWNYGTNKIDAVTR